MQRAYQIFWWRIRKFKVFEWKDGGLHQERVRIISQNPKGKEAETLTYAETLKSSKISLRWKKKRQIRQKEKLVISFESLLASKEKIIWKNKNIQHLTKTVFVLVLFSFGRKSISCFRTSSKERLSTTARTWANSLCSTVFWTNTTSGFLQMKKVNSQWKCP